MANNLQFSTQHSDNLLLWYDHNKRDLPWRENSNPYHIWLSEIMLQQTKVEAVKNYYHRFLRYLPNIEDLASANQDLYLKLWEGLGYYNRVHNLHKAAKIIVQELDGQLPRNFESLQKLPGIGPYTAAAIASIAFNQVVPAIDGNLLRVFSRLTCYKENILTLSAKNSAFNFFSGFISKERPGDFNQALMDLGSTICVPRSQPLCEKCPFQQNCLARLQGKEKNLPVRPLKSKRKTEKITLMLIHFREHLILRKRSSKGLLANLYEFPNVLGKLKQNEIASIVIEMGFNPIRIQKLDNATHIFSHKEWHITGYEIFTDQWSDFSRTKTKGNESKDYSLLKEKTNKSKLLLGLNENRQNYKKNQIVVLSKTKNNKGLFMTSLEDLENKWPLPSAFDKYKNYLLKK